MTKLYERTKVRYIGKVDGHVRETCNKQVDEKQQSI